mgnify:CR=1 FL=1
MTHKASIIPASVVLLLTLMGGVGCSKQQAVQSPAEGNFPADHVIRVAPEVATTKGSYTSDNLTKFDLLVEDSNNPKYTYSNTVFKKSESGWTSDNLLLWSKSEAEVLVYAIAPSVGTVGSASVSAINGDGASLEVQAEQAKDDCSSDYLGWASGRKSVNELLDTDGKLSFAFTHLLTRFTVTFKLGTEFNVSGVPAQDIISDVVVSGTARDFKLKGATGYTSFTVTPGTAASDIKPYGVGWTAAENAQGNCSSVYECILVPQTVAAGGLKISFKVAGKNYEWVSAAGYTLNGNTAYTLTLKVGKDVVIAGGFTATAWTETPGGSLYTE